MKLFKTDIINFPFWSFMFGAYFPVSKAKQNCSWECNDPKMPHINWAVVLFLYMAKDGVLNLFFLAIKLNRTPSQISQLISLRRWKQVIMQLIDITFMCMLCVLEVFVCLSSVFTFCSPIYKLLHNITQSQYFKPFTAHNADSSAQVLVYRMLLRPAFNI